MTKRLNVRPGDLYGRLTIVREISGAPRRRFECRCDCGGTTSVRLTHLRSGGVLSCGCLRAEQAQAIGSNNRTHGQSHTKTHYVWVDMVRRCSKASHAAYGGYGGRGITVCERWRTSFGAFFEDMGECPEGLSIDRIDNNAGYSPGNCRWATRAEQQRNRRNNRLITARGETKCLAEWSERTGLSRHAIAYRLRIGMSPEDALGGGCE